MERYEDQQAPSQSLKLDFHTGQKEQEGHHCNDEQTMK
jgi:hypothetical protein